MRLGVGGCGDDFTETPGGGATGTGGSGGSGAEGGGGAGGGTPAECIPFELGSGEAPADSCGLFVSSSLGSDGNAGTKDSPVATIGHALGLAAAHGGRIYACAEPFTEPLSVSERVELYGGLDCAQSWAYVGDSVKSALSAEPDAVVLTLGPGATGVLVADFALTAQDAAALGGSSIALLAGEGVEAVFERCELSAGAGADGAPGSTEPARATDGENGNAGNVGCTSAALVPGGPTKTNAACAESYGGAGEARRRGTRHERRPRRARRRAWRPRPDELGGV